MNMLLAISNRIYYFSKENTIFHRFSSSPSFGSPSPNTNEKTCKIDLINITDSFSYSHIPLLHGENEKSSQTLLDYRFNKVHPVFFFYSTPSVIICIQVPAGPWIVWIRRMYMIFLFRYKIVVPNDVCRLMCHFILVTLTGTGERYKIGTSQHQSTD